ncbi:MAG TPA: hypothetical protein VHB50_23740 [Bryobacteraceae bacterium]|nr:hypothetical protein [Bryobacteraceae bacterium]
MYTKSLFSLLAAILLSSPLIAQEQRPLPAGNGKETVEAACAQCHSLNLIGNAGHSREQWRTVLSMMVNAGAKVPRDQMPVLLDYLSKNFPPKGAPGAVIVPGSVKVSIEEWAVPTPGSRPHDPLATPDGAIWYTGQMANVLGRLDPATGQIKEFPLKTPGSGPHGLVADKDGNIWFTANFKAYIGKLDPHTGQVTEYPLPASARDPHTPIFDRNGVLWFTVQGANMVGRLDPKTGEAKVVTSPTPKSNPYGMVVSSKGVPFFVEFGSNKVASIDPDTMAIHEYLLPSPNARPRRVAISPDDIIWYSDYARGCLGRLDPATGKVTEWASPGGSKSQPYGIAFLKGAVWYSESAVEPNTMVRFDPKAERFQTWAIPSGGGGVRNVSVTRDGNIAIACSGVNKVGLVEIQ